ncbi:MAG: DUF2071 domain-containing protein [Myxococcota bacterium]
MKAVLERSIVLGYAIDADALAARVPEPLQLDTFGSDGFVAVAMVRTTRLRPAVFPAWLGRSFTLIGYRVFVRYRTSSGRVLRGLYILRSDTDRWMMRWLGNIFTTYRYRRVDVDWQDDGDRTTIRSEGSALRVETRRIGTGVQLPPGSPFPDWKAARKFAGPMPHTFSVDRRRRQVLVVRGRRTEWQPEPLAVSRAECGVLSTLELPEAKLANAFSVESVPYHWDRGYEDPWTDR